MKKNQKICERILESMKRPNVNKEYKKKMLLACKKSKELNYKISPYELDFIL
jgi:hypothetical protein